VCVFVSIVNFWVVTPCWLVGAYQLFGEKYRFYNVRDVSKVAYKLWGWVPHSETTHKVHINIDLQTLPFRITARKVLTSPSFGCYCVLHGCKSLWPPCSPDRNPVGFYDKSLLLSAHNPQQCTVIGCHAICNTPPAIQQLRTSLTWPEIHWISQRTSAALFVKASASCEIL
jgi:hypothetical protein